MPSIPRPTNAPPYPSGSWEYLKSDNDADAFNKTKSASVKLKIAIIGAGVGGLSSAIALGLAGHEVTVYESAKALSEIGAGIQIPPNSARILHSWGLEKALQVKAVQPKSLLWKRWEDGKIIANTRYKPYFKQWFGAPYYVAHRAHLHEVLHQKVVELGIPVHLGRSVIRYDLERAIATFKDGSRISADLIIAADGIKSLARRTILGSNEKGLRNHGIAAYRAAVDIKALESEELIASSVPFDSINFWVGDQAHVMSYSIAGGNSWNLVVTVPELAAPADWDPEDSVSVKQMQSYFDGWDPALRRLLDLVKSTSKWPIQDINCAERWISQSKRLVLLGDAAHAMIPFMSIGAAIAVEDACALAHSLSLMSTNADLDRAVEIYEKVRQRRVEPVHEASYRHAYTIHLPDGEEQRARDAAMADEVDGIHFISSPNQWSDPVTQRWAYMYDAAKDISDAWAIPQEGLVTARL